MLWQISPSWKKMLTLTSSSISVNKFISSVCVAFCRVFKSGINIHFIIKKTNKIIKINRIYLFEWDFIAIQRSSHPKPPAAADHTGCDYMSNIFYIWKREWWLFFSLSCSKVQTLCERQLVKASGGRYWADNGGWLQ